MFFFSGIDLFLTIIKWHIGALVGENNFCWSVTNYYEWISILLRLSDKIAYRCFLRMLCWIGWKLILFLSLFYSVVLCRMENSNRRSREESKEVSFSSSIRVFQRANWFVDNDLYRHVWINTVLFNALLSDLTPNINNYAFDNDNDFLEMTVENQS